ncbi:hypothetical protein WDW86_09180 [Bdellovibrionota bacterium FG-2]
MGEAYGFGSRSSALAGIAQSEDGFSAYSNPAALPFSGERRLIFGWALMSVTPRFLPISNVVVENEYTSDKVTIDSVDNNYRPTFGQAMGLVYRLFPGFYNFTFGLTGFIPIEQVAYLDSGETFEPEYVLYRSRTNRPQIEAGIGMEFGYGFRLGAGIHTAYSLTSDATVFLQTDSSKPSTMRFISSMKPKAAPYFGAYLGPSDGSGWFSLSSVLRLPVASANNMTLHSGARAIGNFVALDFNFSSISALYYDPMTVELGASLKPLPFWTIFFQADYQAWSKFVAPQMEIVNPQTTGSEDQSRGVNISAGKSPTFEFIDLWVPRVGQEFKIGPVSLRAGYAYRPSFLKGTPAGPGNYLDPAKHMWNGGLGYRFEQFLHFPTPCELSLHASYHRMVTQHVTKDPGDENGARTGDLKIGAPGYDAGGYLLGGGATLTLAF